MRTIPALMASQHPDHASTPYWLADPFIRVHEEIEESHRTFFELGIDEYKWDWEGKYVDEAVVERLLSTYYDEFSKSPLGKDKFLTFRLPNPKVESEYRLGRAFMGILAAAGFAKTVGMNSPPLFEAILPMTEDAQELIEMQKAFSEIMGLQHPLLKLHDREKLDLELIPLFEQTEVILHADAIIREYLEYMASQGRPVSYMRPYIARSDPALNAGIIPTVLAVKVGLSRFARLSKELNLPLYPVFGCAALPFRGGLTPDTIDEFVNQYAGVRTVLIQSAFRYDYPLEQVKERLNYLKKKLPETPAVEIPVEEEAVLEAIVLKGAAFYQEVIPSIAATVNAVAKHIPKRRERVQHTGLFGYSRSVGEVQLPRAIGFTGALYSIGVPPEVIGTGRLWQSLSGHEQELVRRYYPFIITDLRRAFSFLCMDNLRELAKKNDGWNAILQDVTILEKEFYLIPEPETDEEKEHHVLARKIFEGLDNGTLNSSDIVSAGVKRRSLG